MTFDTVRQRMPLLQLSVVQLDMNVLCLAALSTAQLDGWDIRWERTARIVIGAHSSPR